MTLHGMDYYCIIKFHMDNLLRGVYPLWDPFQFWGRPDNIDGHFVGEYNPFMWLYIIFSLLGVPLPLSWLSYAIIYYFLGLTAFYLLAKRVFKDTNYAVISFTLLLFSSLIGTVLNNFCITLLFVPVIWFFYFLVAFTQEPKKIFFLGLIFSLMIIAITYMPFYFLSVLFPFLMTFACLYYRSLRNIVSRYFQFAQSHKRLIFVSFICLLIALLPGWLWYQSGKEGETVLSWRHQGSASKHSASMDITTINPGGIIGPITFRNLFSQLDTPQHLMFFVPVFVYLMLCLSLINRLNRKLLLLFFTFFFIFLLSLTDITPVHKFLYDHLFIFKLFRNMFYFAYFAIPLVILFAVEQLRLFLNRNPQNNAQKIFLFLYLIGIHCLFVLFLHHEGEIIISSYLTIGLSLLFFLAAASGFLKKGNPVTTGLFLIIITLQPLQVFDCMIKSAASIVPWTTYERFIPRFSYVRRTREEGPVIFKGHMDGLQDHSGFNNWKYSGLANAFLVHENINHDILEKYTHYKFFLYDHIDVMDTTPDFKQLEKALETYENTAFVAGPLRSSLLPSESEKNSVQANAQPIIQNSREFTVTNFDLNHITLTTDFDTRKFLVYTDSFHKNWNAFMNGKPVEIFQTNIAFKGIWLPPGKNIIRLQYGSFGTYFFSFFMIATFYGFLGYLLRQYWKDSFLQNKKIPVVDIKSP